jgi:hypothetical protein
MRKGGRTARTVRRGILLTPLVRTGQAGRLPRLLPADEELRLGHQAIPDRVDLGELLHDGHAAGRTRSG